MYCYYFKEVCCDVSSEGEWLYMLNDEEGTVVYSYQLMVADEEDYKAAKYFGWSDDQIETIRIYE